MTEAFPYSIEWMRQSRIWLEQQIYNLLPEGARAEQLVLRAPDLIEAICPEDQSAGLDLHDRAAAVEGIIRLLLLEVDRRPNYAPQGRALLGLLGLSNVPELQGASLRERTKYAATLAGVSPDWFRRRRQEEYITPLVATLFNEMDKRRLYHPYIDD